MTLEQQIWETVVRNNHAWALERNCQGLHEFFHEKMVAITPADKVRRVGRQSCVEGWQGFVDSCRMLSWEETNPLIEVFADGRAAVVAYDYRAVAVFGDSEVELCGRDLMTLVFEAGRWQLIADHFSPFPR